MPPSMVAGTLLRLTRSAQQGELPAARAEPVAIALPSTALVPVPAAPIAHRSDALSAAVGTRAAQVSLTIAPPPIASHARLAPSLPLSRGVAIAPPSSAACAASHAVVIPPPESRAALVACRRQVICRVVPVPRLPAPRMAAHPSARTLLRLGRGTRSVRASGEWLVSVPLVRRRARYVGDLEIARMRILLAQALGANPAQVQWIGLFHHVPLAAAQSIDIDGQRGVMSVTLKENAAESARRRRLSLASVSVAVGRSRISGALVQALIS